MGLGTLPIFAQRMKKIRDFLAMERMEAVPETSTISIREAM